MQSEKGFILIVVCVFVMISSMITTEMIRTVITQNKLLESFKAPLRESCSEATDRK